MTAVRGPARAAVILFGVYVVSQGWIASLLHPLGRDVLRLQTTGDPEEVQRIMTSWTPEQRAQYRKHLPPDTLHPLIYASALIAAGIAGHAATTPTWARSVAIAAPAASTACDLAENALHARFVNHPGRTTRSAARAATLFTRTKWALALGTAAALLTRSARNR